MLPSSNQGAAPGSLAIAVCYTVWCQTSQPPSISTATMDPWDVVSGMGSPRRSESARILRCAFQLTRDEVHSASPSKTFVHRHRLPIGQHSA